MLVFIWSSASVSWQTRKQSHIFLRLQQLWEVFGALEEMGLIYNLCVRLYRPFWERNVISGRRRRRWCVLPSLPWLPSLFSICTAPTYFFSWTFRTSFSLHQQRHPEGNLRRNVTTFKTTTLLSFSPRTEWNRFEPSEISLLHELTLVLLPRMDREENTAGCLLWFMTASDTGNLLVSCRLLRSAENNGDLIQMVSGGLFRKMADRKPWLFVIIGYPVINCYLWIQAGSKQLFILVEKQTNNPSLKHSPPP